MKRRGWDSNPRALADKRFSRPPRYDHFDTPARERVMGIEPTYLAWKASVLPLNYTRIFNCSQVGVTGFEPATSWSQTRRSSQAEPHPDMLFCRFVFVASPKRLRYNITLFHTCQHFFTFFWNLFFKCDTSRVFTMFSITWNNSFNKRLCTITCKAFIYAVLQEKRRFYHKPPFSGLDGSRTRVRNTIPCPSTSVVYYLTFPLPHDNKQPCGFSSFMIRPMAQSFANVVSHIVEAWVLKCECSRSDCCH